MFENDVAEVLLSEKQISDKVKEMGAMITRDFEGEEIIARYSYKKDEESDR